MATSIFFSQGLKKTMENIWGYYQPSEEEKIAYLKNQEDIQSRQVQHFIAARTNFWRVMNYSTAQDIRY